MYIENGVYVCCAPIQHEGMSPGGQFWDYHLDQVPLDEKYRHPILSWVAMSDQIIAYQVSSLSICHQGDMPYTGLAAL